MPGVRGTGLFVAVLAGAALLGACKGKTEARQAPGTPGGAAAQPGAPETSEPPPARVASFELPWIEDDYDAALGRARAGNKPLVIDMWAAWCHTCLSMKHTVLADPSLEPLADRFVWLALDTEDPATATAQEKFPVQVWPTFYIVSPAGEAVQARHQGAASVAQFRALLAEGERGHLDTLADGGKLAADSPQRLAREGDRAAARGAWAEAARHYANAIAEAPDNWSRLSDVLVGLASALARAKDYETCVALGRARMHDTGRTASASDFAYWTATCASELPANDDQATAAISALRAAAASRLETLLADASAPLSVDDRADGMRILREIYLSQDRSAEARTLARKQQAVLEQAAATATAAFETMTFHWPRLEVALFLEDNAQLAKLENVFTESERQLPGEYDPPYRLASLLYEQKRYDEALAAARRAQERVYGPRTANVLDLIARIEKARGNKPGERAARKAAVTLWQSLPPGQKRPDKQKAAREALAALD